jgi:hypothetical protein
MSHPALAGHDALLDAASEVALNLRAHGSYRGSQRRALSALKGRRPGFHSDQYQHALDSAIVPPLAQRCPGFPESTYISLLNWLDIYYYQM